jgi:hypothetical protein
MATSKPRPRSYLITHCLIRVLAVTAATGSLRH